MHYSVIEFISMGGKSLPWRSVYDVRITRNMNTRQYGKLLFYHKQRGKKSKQKNESPRSKKGKR